MRVVRIDQLAPGGAALEVHPRLTLLRGASPELRRRLLSSVRALCGDGDVAESGVLEVSGVQLSLDPATVAQLAIEPGIDPVLLLGGAPTGAAADQVEPAPSLLPPPVEVVSTDEAALRAELREVTVARTDLGARMDQAREGLDSFSTAALEVCRGQIDALESRRATLRVDWEREQAERDAELEVASAQLAGVRALADRIAGLDALRRRILEARAALADAGARAASPDPGALQLAAQLDAAAARVRDLEDRHHQMRSQLDRLTEELLTARRAADDAERAVRAPQVDRGVVQRLEQVRDEIFAVDDRQSVLGAARNKRRLAELRSEEAILLDHLGFDTYSAYVMGIPSVRADLERSAQVDTARDRADQLEAEVAVLRTRLADRSEPEDAAAQLRRLFAESLRVLGRPPEARDGHELAHGVASGTDVADLVHQTAGALRLHTTADPAVVQQAAATLAAALVEATAAAAAIRVELPAGPVSLRPIPPLGIEGVQGDEPLDVASRWLDWFDELQAWGRATETSVVELERRVARRGAGHDPDRIGRWAEVEAELDEALDRLAEAQERVRAHEAATAELADLRVCELELRDRERDLLARIAAADAAIVPPQPPPPPPPAVGPADQRVDGLPVGGDADAVEWAVVARLALQRTVSFVGSLPLVVDGLPGDPAARDAVLRRLDRMSDLIQVIVVAEDDAAAAWAAGLGERGRRVDL
jgi:hypothetical protein